MLSEKIVEEAIEVINFKNKENLIWEAADLIYFLTVFMERNDVKFKDIKKELEVRSLMKNYLKTTKLSETKC